MPKAERGTPKDIAKRIKAKGLQKLKFYCQMCEKQCRDANGFKCHMTSESHLRNMQVFARNANGMLDRLSREFELTYLSTLKMRHGTKRVNANNIYQEVIQDRHHIHMNATKWTTLSSFVQYLGRKGKCRVEETERGWYISYIERDAGILQRQEEQERRQLAEQEAEARFQKQMEKQRHEAAAKMALLQGDESGNFLERKATKLNRNETGGEISLSLENSKAPALKSSSAVVSSVFANEDGESDDDDGDGNESDGNNQNETKPPPSKRQRTLDHVKGSSKQENATMSERNAKNPTRPATDYRKDYWLHKDILVRIKSNESLPNKYHGRKAFVLRVTKDDPYVAKVELLDSGPREQDGGDILRLDQDDLETVIPQKLHRQVKIVNGPGRGQCAQMIAVQRDKLTATLKLNEGKELQNVSFRDFSKMG